MGKGVPFNQGIPLKRIQQDLVVLLKVVMDNFNLDIILKDMVLKGRCQLIMDNQVVMANNLLAMELHNQDQVHYMVVRGQYNPHQTMLFKGLFLHHNLVMLTLPQLNKAMETRQAMETLMMTILKALLSMYTIKVRGKVVLVLVVWIQVMCLLHLAWSLPLQRAEIK
jgi:hypothetical protein